MLERFGSNRRAVAITALLVVALAAFVRLYNIDWAFSTNGIDEGIMLERAKMVELGFQPYGTLPLDQAPLAILLGGDLWGNVTLLRVFVATVSVVAVLACMESARRIKGNVAMLVTGALLALDFTLVRESRLFSLNSLSSSVLAVSILFFVLYLQKKSRLSLAAAGLLVGIATSVKLFGVLGFAGMALFMVIGMARERSSRRRVSADLTLLAVAAILPVVALMLYLGPSAMIQGMLFDQGHRAFEPVQKLGFLPYLGTNAAYAMPLIVFRRLWKGTPEIKFLLCLSVVIIAFMLVQPLMYYHHLVMLSPPLSILAGVFVVSLPQLRKERPERSVILSRSGKGTSIWGLSEVAMAAGLLISAGLIGYGLAAQGEPTQQVAAEKIAEITGPSDYVVSGDPLITAYANRPTPPSLINVAYSQYPDISTDEVENGIVDNGVKVVVLAYRLNSMSGLAEFLDSHGYTEVSRDFFGYGDGIAIYTFNRAIEPFSFFVRDDVVSSFGLPAAP